MGVPWCSLSRVYSVQDRVSGVDDRARGAGEGRRICCVPRRPVASLLLGLLVPNQVDQGGPRLGWAWSAAAGALYRHGTLNTARICIAAAIIQIRPLGWGECELKGVVDGTRNQPERTDRINSIPAPA